MSYIGKIPATGNFVKLDAISVVNGQASYTMQSNSVNFTPESANHMLVSLNGVIQAPITSFSVSGSTITFASALSTGDVINFIMVYGNVLDIGTPSDDTVSAAKLKTDSVIEAKIQDDAVTRDKINAISTSSLPSFEAKGTAGQTDGYIQLNCEQNSHGIKLKSPPHSAGQSYTLTFPSTAPATDKFIKTDNSGNLSFADAGGNMTPVFQAYLNGDQNISDVTTTKVTLNTEDFDSDSAFDSTTNYRFTVPSGKAGKYLFNGAIAGFAGTSSDLNLSNAFLYKNGSSVLENRMDYRNNPGRNANNSFSVILDLAVSDYIELYGYMDDNSGSPNPRFEGDTTVRKTFLNGYKIIE